MQILRIQKHRMTSTQSTRGRACGGCSHGRGCARGRGTPTGTQSHDKADKSSASTSTDNIRCSSYGRQIFKKFWMTEIHVHVYICMIQ